MQSLPSFYPLSKPLPPSSPPLPPQPFPFGNGIGETVATSNLDADLNRVGPPRVYYPPPPSPGTLHRWVSRRPLDLSVPRSARGPAGLKAAEDGPDARQLQPSISLVPKWAEPSDIMGQYVFLIACEWLSDSSRFYFLISPNVLIKFNRSFCPADHMQDLCKNHFLQQLYRKIDGAVLQSQNERNLDCVITFQTHSILQRFMLRFDLLQLDCNDHLFIYDGAHAVGNYKPPPPLSSPTELVLTPPSLERSTDIDKATAGVSPPDLDLGG
uniref:Uncharacterized protein n=1 Tax=Timema bartmani TaxID=61472 RepID=A0A7R9EPW9_9NEOP|nr:unnamed protein product [Timema bartmani]